MKKVTLVSISIWILGLASAETALGQAASCAHPIQGKIVYDVQNAEGREGWSYFKANRKVQEWFWNISPKMQKDIAASYTGCFIDAAVVKSDARKKGLNTAQTEFAGQKVKLFLQGKHDQCLTLKGQRFNAQLGEVCCDGRSESPCLYKTPLLINAPTALGKSGGNRGNRDTEKALRNKNYQTATQYMKKQNYKLAAEQYELAKKSGDMDQIGFYNLALAYRQMELCDKVISTLAPVQVKWERNEYWAPEEAAVRKSVFLLARCYSMSNDASRATVILNSYLSDPKKFKEEIYEARTHADFGWIRTTKEYRGFMDESGKVRFE